MQFTIDNEEYIDLEEVVKETGMKQTLLYEKMRYNAFPKPEKKHVPISFIRKRALWKKSEIEAYVDKGVCRKNNT